MSTKPTDRTLFSNKWLSLKEIVDPERGVNGYVYSHETRCKGRIVLVMPFRRSGDGHGPFNSIEVLLRRETTPCWGMEPSLSGITGGVEGDRPLDDAIRELKEESGYEAAEDEFIYLGTCRGTKSTDTVYHLYAVDVTGKEQGEATGDGSALDDAPVEWHRTAVDCDDPQAAFAYLKLVHAFSHWRSQ